jgi:hypothetical protein
MKNTTKLKLGEIKRNGYNLNIGDVLSETLKNYKKTVWVNGAGFLLFAFVLVGITTGLSAIVFGADTFSNAFGDFQIANFSLVEVFFTLLIAVVLAAIICPFYAGLLKVSHHAATHKTYSFSTVFDYYKSDLLRQLVISGVLISSASSLIVTLIKFSGYIFLVEFITYFIQFLTVFTIPFIIFGKLKALEAVEASILIVSRNFFAILLLMILSIIMTCLGLIALLIGIFFTLPIIFSMQYIIYKKAVGIYDEDSIDDIGIDIQNL